MEENKNLQLDIYDIVILWNRKTREIVVDSIESITLKKNGSKIARTNSGYRLDIGEKRVISLGDTCMCCSPDDEREILDNWEITKTFTFDGIKDAFVSNYESPNYRYCPFLP